MREPVGDGEVIVWTAQSDVDRTRYVAAFWTGTQQQYFDFYKRTAVALKRLDARLRVNSSTGLTSPQAGQRAIPGGRVSGSRTLFPCSARRLR